MTSCWHWACVVAASTPASATPASATPASATPTTPTSARSTSVAAVTLVYIVFPPGCVSFTPFNYSMMTTCCHWTRVVKVSTSSSRAAPLTSRRSVIGYLSIDFRWP